MAVIPASEYVNSTVYSPDFVITGDERSILPFGVPKFTGPPPKNQQYEF